MKIKLTFAIFVAVISITCLSSANSDAATSNWQKGVSIQPTSSQDFSTSSFHSSVDSALANGVNFITLVIPVHQDSIRSSNVFTGSDTPSDSSIASATKYIITKGASVGYAVHVNTYDGQWRAMIDADNRQQWFTSYGQLLQNYGRIAQSNNASQIILGTELTGMTNPNINPTNTENWINLIQSVRSVYDGSLTYSAQRAGYRSDAQELGFWSKLDKIGISAYYEMGSNNSPSVEELKQRWERWNNDEIKPLSQRYGKPVVFTEVGYVSRDRSLEAPGLGYELNTSLNQNIQARAYQALFEYWNDYSYMEGVSIWDWLSNPNGGGANSGEYTPQNKLAQQVMNDWFSRKASPDSTPNSYATSSTYADGLINAVVSSSQQIDNAIVDVEIYDSNGKQIKQQFFENQTINSLSSKYSFSWTPSVDGIYSIKIGIFSAGWSKNYLWNSSSGTVTIKAPSQSVQSPESPTNTPIASTTFSIWWPGGSQKVNGVQPFKAVLDGKDMKEYRTYWQVDGDLLNEMGNVYDQAPHKESLVDLSGWNWKATKQYTINFVAKKITGEIINQKPVTINLQ